MEANYTLDVPSFGTHEDEVNFWRERYLNLERERNEVNTKYQELDRKFRRLESCHTCNTEEDPEHPVKNDDTTMDPLIKLEEPIAHKIMKYLSGNELLQAMEVSSGWKRFIEERPSLMNRAMDQVIVKPNVEGWSITQLSNALDNSGITRFSRHMESPIAFTSTVLEVSDFASSLETLTIPFNDDGKHYYVAIKGCSFIKLQSLVIHAPNTIECFKNCSFPVVTELKFDWPSFDKIREYLALFPQLKNLELFGSFMGYHDFGAYHCSFDPLIPSFRITKIRKETKDKPQPKIDQIKCGKFHSFLIIDHQQTLSVFDVEFVYWKEISWLFRDLKVLKSLSIWNIDTVLPTTRAYEILSKNTSIKILKIGRFCCNYRYTSTRLDLLKNILSALPSMKEFELHRKVAKDLILFIATNMSSLKKLICHELNEEAIQAYQEVRATLHQYVNSTFEIVPELNDPRANEDSAEDSPEEYDEESD